jgi:hypothetical protein
MFGTFYGWNLECQWEIISAGTARGEWYLGLGNWPLVLEEQLAISNWQLAVSTQHLAFSP